MDAARIIAVIFLTLFFIVFSFLLSTRSAAWYIFNLSHGHYYNISGSFCISLFYNCDIIMTFSLHTALFSSFFHKLPGQESGQTGIGMQKNPPEIALRRIVCSVLCSGCRLCLRFLTQEINGCLADYLIKDNEHRRQDEDYACHTDQGTS